MGKTYGSVLTAVVMCLVLSTSCPNYHCPVFGGLFAVPALHQNKCVYLVCDALRKQVHGKE